MSRLYYLYGKDIHTVKSKIAKITNEFGNDIIKISGKDIDLAKLEDCAMQFPMFSEFNVIHIDDLNAEDLSSDKIAQLIGILNAVPASTKIFFSATGFDIYNGKKAISPKNKKILDCVKSIGEIQEFPMPTRQQLVKILCDSAKIGSETANLLCDYCLDDKLCALNELEKMSSFCGQNEITPQVVLELVAKRLDANAFALARAVTAFDGRTVFRILDELFAQQAEPVAIWAAISNSFLDIYRAKTASLRGKSSRDIAENFDYKGKEFVVTNAIRAAERVQIPRLRRCISIISETDVELKSGKIDKKVQIEISITKMLAGF